MPETTILMTWELGSGLGHMTSMKPVALGLLKRGYRVIVALKNFANASKVFKNTGVEYLPAPGRRGPIVGEFKIPSTFAQILHNIGFGDVAELLILASAWRRIFDLVRPGLIVTDHSPTAMLAARGFSAPVVALGTGFECPAACHPFPDWLPGLKNDPQQLLRDEQQVLRNANETLRYLGDQQLEVLSDLYRQVDDTLLITYPELDAFGKREGADYLGTWPEIPGEPPQWPAGDKPRVFAYLRPMKGIHILLKVLSVLKLPTILRFPLAPPKLRQEFCAPNLSWETRFIDIQEAARQSDFAICHATHVMSASMLLGGTPMLMLPPFLEQSLNARNIVKLGAGIAGHVEKLSEAQLHLAFRNLITQEEYRVCAEKFASKYTTVDRCDQLHKAIEKLDKLLP